MSTQQKKGKYNYLGYWGTDGNLKFIREEEITEQIALIFDSLKMPDDQLDAMRKSLQQGKNAEQEFHKSELRRLRIDMDRVDSKRSALVDMLMEKQIDQDTYEEKKMEYNRSKAEIAARIKAYEQTDDQFHEKIVKLYTVAQGYAENWRWITGKLADMADSCERSSKIEQIRKFLKSVFRTLEIKDGNLGFLPHTPFDILQKNTVCHVWSGRHDSNMRHLAPKASTLPS